MNHFLSNFKSQWSTLQTKLGADNDEAAPTSADVPSADALQQQQQQTKVTTELETDDKIRPSQIANRVFGMAKKASSKLQEKATNISAIVSERTIIGNIEKERQKFMEELRKEGKCVDEIGLDGLLADVEAQHHIIAISSNPRNLTEEPPHTFDLDSDIALVKQYAEALFRLDPRLAVLRFEIVPKQVPEEQFWRNYAYRISLVRKFVNEKRTTQTAAADDDEQQQCSATVEVKSKCSESHEDDDQSKNRQKSAVGPSTAEDNDDDEEKLLEKELLNDLNEFEMVEDAKKDGCCGDERDAGNEHDEDDDDEKMGDELDKQLDELLDSNSSN